MNKIVKWILILINLVGLYLAYRWHESQDPSFEPIIVVVLQLSTIVGLFFENNIGTSINKFKNFNTGSINSEGGNVRIGDNK